MKGINKASLLLKLENQLVEMGYPHRSVRKHLFRAKEVLSVSSAGTIPDRLRKAERWAEDLLRKKRTYYKRYLEYKCEIRRLRGMLGEECNWNYPTVAKYQTTPYYSDIIGKIRTYGETHWGKATSHQVISATRHFFCWLSEHRCSTLGMLTDRDVRRYLKDRGKVSTGSGMQTVRFDLKKTLSGLKDLGLIENDYRDLLSFPSQFKKRLLPALTNREVGSILQAAQSTTPAGKRNFAIVMIALTTGLRQSDILGLRLADIDWRQGEIRVVQRKTGVPICLPLVRKAGIALRDYILNCRPHCDSDRIFIRSWPPYAPLANGSLQSRYRKITIKAGMTRTWRDGKSFHALRRTFGRNLVSCGTPLPLVSQILGHTRVNSTSRYISLDSRGLKSCALDLSGLEPLGWRKRK